MRFPALAITAALAAVALTPVSAEAADGTFYVDCGSGGGGDGSVGSPWNSLAAVNGHGEFSPGDRILLKRGVTCGGQLAPGGSGAPGHPITIGAYGSGAAPTVAGGGTGTWTGAVQLTDQQYWTIEDLHVTNSDGATVTPKYESGVILLNRNGGQLHGITVQRLRIDHVVSSMSDDANGSRTFGGISAVTMPNLSGAGFTDLLIADNDISHVGRTGIITTNISYPAGQDVRPRITGNRVDHARGDGIVMLGAVDGRIDHDVSSNANDEWPCPDCGGISYKTANAAIWTGASKRVRIDHNEAYGTKQLGGDGEGFDVDWYADDTLLEANYAHDNEGGGMLFCGSNRAVARFNIFEDNRKSQLAFIGIAVANDTTIANNTFSISKASGAGMVRTFDGYRGNGIRFVNNLVYSYGNGVWAWPTKPVTAGNTIVGKNGAGRPTDRTTSHTAPALRAPGTGGVGMASLSGYRLRAGATSRNGTPSSRSGTVDFFGKTVSPARLPRGAAG